MARDRRVVWAPAARGDLRDIWRYHKHNASPDLADRMLLGIQDSVARLDRLEVPGRPRDELLPGLRSILAHRHVIFFRIGDGTLEVVRVLHERRDVATLGRLD